MRKVTLLLAAVSLALFNLLPAQNAFDAVRIVQDEAGFGARALAMGGAYSGVADDYSAIYWNPAGLAQIRRSNFFGEVSHLNFNNAATFQQSLSDESQNYTRLNSLGFAFALPTRRGSFAIALGYNRVKDFDQNLTFSGFNRESNGLGFDFGDDFYLFDKDIYQTEQINEEGGLNQWSIGAGVALSPNFTAGITGNVWDGESEYQFTFLQQDRDDLYRQFPADFDSYMLSRTIKTDYSGFGLKLGGMFSVGNDVRLGGAVGLPTTFTVKENYQANDRIVFDNGDEDVWESDPGLFEYKVKTPFYFDGGISFSNGALTLAGSARYRDWSQTRFEVSGAQVGDPNYSGLLAENQRLRRDFRSTLQYHLGGELLLPGSNVLLRGGYAVYPSPLKNASGDLDKRVISGGMGFLLDRYVSLDFTYLRGSWQQESVDEFTPGGTLEEITTHKVLVGFSYRF